MAHLDLYDAARALLDACVDILDDPPDRVYVNAAAPADDVEEYLCVWADPLEWLEPAANAEVGWGQGEMQQIASVNRSTLNVRVMRSAAKAVNRGKPRLEDIDDAARRVLQDAWMLANGVRRRIERGELLDGLTASLVGTLSAVTESGFTVGWQMIVQVTIEGYDPEASL